MHKKAAEDKLAAKKLTLEDLKQVTGGFSPTAISAKAEDASGNKAEAG